MLFNYYTISSLINAVTSFALTYLILSRNPRAEINRIFCLFTFSVGFWSINHFFAFAIQKENLALFFHRALMMGAIFIPTTYFHFVCLLLDKYEKRKKIIKIGYCLSAFFALTNLTPFFISGTSSKLQFKFFENPGIFYHPFLLMFTFYTIYSHALLLKGMNKSTSTKQNQIKFVFLGTLIGFIGGSTSFFLVYNIPVPPFGDPLVSIYVILVSYSIAKYRLMDIRLAITNTAIFLVVYALVLGAPFYTYHLGHHFFALISMLVLASTGQFIYEKLRKNAEKKLFEEQIRYQTTLNNASKAMKRFNTTDDIIHHISVILFKSIGLKNVAFYLRKGDRLVNIKTETNSDLYSVEITDKNLIKYLINKNQPVVVKEIQFESNKNNSNFNVFINESITEVVVPLVLEDRLDGIIMLGEKNDGSVYSELDFNILNQISNTVSLAIDKAFHIEAEKKRNEDENKDRRQFQLDRFASSMGHQIRNPVNIIANNVKDNEILFKKYKNVIKPEYYQMFEDNNKEIFATCDGISDTIRSILDYGRGNIDLKRIKINDILKQFNILNQLVIEKYGVRPIVEIEDNLPEVFGDINMTVEVLMVYLENSCQALSRRESDKKLEFKVFKVGNEWVRFKFIDNGEGIDEDTQKAIFDVSTSTKASEGNGIGLFRVRKACSRMKGSNYDFHSDGRGHGASFWIDLAIQSDNTLTK